MVARSREYEPTIRKRKEPMTRMRVGLIFAVSAASLLFGTALHAGETEVMVYKTPTCGCCSKWVDHLEANGFKVKSKNLADVSPVKRMNGVPLQLSSCHTAIIGGYFVEGHVPAEDVKRLLKERPDVAGIAVPRMPEGSPGMEGPNPEPYSVLAVKKDGSIEVFARHGP